MICKPDPIATFSAAVIAARGPSLARMLLAMMQDSRHALTALAIEDWMWAIWSSAGPRDKAAMFAVVSRGIEDQCKDYCDRWAAQERAS